MTFSTAQPAIFISNGLSATSYDLVVQDANGCVAPAVSITLSEPQPLSLTAVVSSDYIVELTDTNGCVLTDTVLVEVNPNVLLDAGNDTAICFGDSVAVGNNISPDSTTFSWESAILVLDSNSGETMSFPKSSQWIYLTAINDTCSSKDSVYIEVNSLPDITINPQDTSICFDDTVIFQGSGALHYVWYKNEDSVSDGNYYELISDDSMSLIVEGTDSNGCVNTDTSIISVLFIF